MNFKVPFLFALLVSAQLLFSQSIPRVYGLRMDPSSLPVGPSVGVMWHNNVDNKIYLWTGATWVSLSEQNTDSQNLTLTGTDLSISGGNTVNLSGLGGSSVALTDFSVTTASPGSAGLSYDDNGTFTFTPPDLSTYLTSEVDGSVTNEIQSVETFTLTGTTLTLGLTNDGVANSTVDLAGLQDGTGTDDQTATEVSVADAGGYFDGGTVELVLQEIGIDISTLQAGGADGNDFVTSASLTGTTLTLGIPNQTDVTVNLAGLQDGTGTDDQTLTLNANTLSIESGNSVDLSAYLDNTDSQTLTLDTNMLSISDGNNVNLSVYLDNTDSQTAAQVPIADSGGNFTATDVEGALAELASQSGGGSNLTTRVTEATSARTPTVADVGKVITTTGTDQIVVSQPTGVYSTGQTITFQQAGTGKILFDFTEGFTGEKIRTTGLGAAVALDYDGANWNAMGRYEIVDTTPPSVPTSLQNITQTTNSLTYNWTASTDAQSGVAFYEYSLDGGAATNIGDVTDYTLTGLSSGTTYAFRVRAVDVEGNTSAYTSAVNGTTTVGNLYTTANAANPISDDNSTTGVTGTFITTVESGITPTSGARSLRFTHPGPDNTSQASLIALGTLTVGQSYNVTFDVYRGASNFFNFQFFLSTDYGWTVQDSSGNIATSGEWQEVTLTATAGSATPSLRVTMTSGGDTNNWILVDNIRITQN